MIWCFVMCDRWVIRRRNVIYIYSKKPHLGQLFFRCQISGYDVIRWMQIRFRFLLYKIPSDDIISGNFDSEKVNHNEVCYYKDVLHFFSEWPKYYTYQKSYLWYSNLKWKHYLYKKPVNACTTSTIGPIYQVSYNFYFSLNLKLNFSRVRNINISITQQTNLTQYLKERFAKNFLRINVTPKFQQLFFLGGPDDFFNVHIIKTSTRIKLVYIGIFRHCLTRNDIISSLYTGPI